MNTNIVFITLYNLLYSFKNKKFKEEKNLKKKKKKKKGEKKLKTIPLLNCNKKCSLFLKLLVG
jgi:hypothetical protein